MGTGNCFGCVKDGNKVKHCPMIKDRGKKNIKAQARGSSSDHPKKNRFSVLCSKVVKEDSPDVVTSMLQVYTIDVYALVVPGATLSFVTPLVAKKFDVLPDIFGEPFVLTTPVGDSVVAKRVFGNFPISLLCRVTLVDLVEWLIFMSSWEWIGWMHH